MPTTSENFDAIIIGTGQACPALANSLTKAGMSVAVIERAAIGGTCVNAGCTPTKTMVASAYVAHMAARAGEYGVVLPGPPQVDMGAVKARANGIVMRSRTGLERWLSSMPGCSLIRGHARFNSSRSVLVNERMLSAEKIFINVGGRPLVPEIEGLSDVSFLTSTQILQLDEIPRHLVIIGGSYVGLEFAQMFRRFGAQVTVIERGSHLLPREDAAISAEIQTILQNEGVQLIFNAECIRLQKQGDGVAVSSKGIKDDVVGSHVLLAVGRIPNTDDLGLSEAGVETDARGFIKVDGQLKTTASDIWALGDCNGQGAFTHTAYDDFEVVSSNLLEHGKRLISDRIPAYALYIDPPLGRVGMTESQALQAGHNVKVAQRLMKHVSRAVERGESQGLMRIVVDADTEAVLGAAILGIGGDEAVHMLMSAMLAGATVPLLADMMAIHPTVSEYIPTILRELQRQPTNASKSGAHADEALDEALKETFPSSDPVAVAVSKAYIR